MKFTMKRQTGMIGAAIKLTVYINDEKVYALARNEEKTFDVEGDKVVVCVGQSFVKSNAIEVSDNQTVIAKSSWLGNLFSFFGRNSFYLEIEQ